MADLTRRRLEPEVMDDPGLDPELHAGALRGLARINALSGSARSFWPAIRRLAPVRVLDLACGGGDVAVRLAVRAKREGVRAEFAGCDISPTALNVARRRAESAGVAVEFFRRDLFADGPPAGYDVLTCSLFLHHLDETQAVTLLRQMSESAGRLVLVNDLRRSGVGLLLARVVTRVVTRSPVVHVDGPQSVEAAFTLPEVRSLAERAGLRGAEIRPTWPCRFLLTWHRAPEPDRTSPP
jgi:2-polyprenyl-3-methyl-5-hydroxy-6-metoxy-1,4-benzoquinol methylase